MPQEKSFAVCLICHARISASKVKKKGTTCPSCGAPQSQFVPETMIKALR